MSMQKREKAFVIRAYRASLSLGSYSFWAHFWARLGDAALLVFAGTVVYWTLSWMVGAMDLRNF